MHCCGWAGAKNNLDLANQYEVLDLVREQVAAEGKTVIAVMHDINAALRYVTEFLFLKEGPSSEISRSSEVSRHCISMQASESTRGSCTRDRRRR